MKLDADLQPPCLEPEGPGPGAQNRDSSSSSPFPGSLPTTSKDRDPAVPVSQIKPGRRLVLRACHQCRPLVSGHRDGVSRPGPPSAGRRRRNLKFKLNLATCTQGAGATRPPNFEGPGLATSQVRSGQVRFITRPTKSRTMRAKAAFATSEVTSLESSYARIFRDDTAEPTTNVAKPVCCKQLTFTEGGRRETTSPLQSSSTAHEARASKLEGRSPLLAVWPSGSDGEH